MALGDGCINKNGTLCIQHSMKQYEYLCWKARLIEEAFNTTINIKKREDVKFPYCRFYFTSKQTKRLREILYSDKKHLDYRVLNLLKTPTALTIWYLDDGSMVIHRNKERDKITGRELVIHTQNLTHDEHLTIRDWFKKNYNIGIRINKDRKYFKTVMSAKSAVKFLALLDNCIPVSMEYKTDMKYLY